MIAGQVLLIEIDRTDIDTKFDVRVGVGIGFKSAIIGTVSDASACEGAAVCGRGTSGGVDAEISGIDEGVGGALRHALVLHHVERIVDEVECGARNGADSGGIKRKSARGAVLYAIAIGGQI